MRTVMWSLVFGIGGCALSAGEISLSGAEESGFVDPRLEGGDAPSVDDDSPVVITPEDPVVDHVACGVESGPTRAPRHRLATVRGWGHIDAIIA